MTIQVGDRLPKANFVKATPEGPQPVDSEDYFRSSGVELDGEKEKRLHSVEFKSLPAGEYTLRAQVLSKQDVLGTATGGLVVTGITPER